MRPPAGRRMRTAAVAAAGSSIVACTTRCADASVYESGPKRVGAARTSIRRPGVSHARGVAYASCSPRGVSWRSSSRSVSRNAAFETLFGGRYIDRNAWPWSGATVAPSPATNVPGVIAPASWP